MRLYDTMARAIVEVAPEGKALTMYSCGPTVYRDAHIGNLRTFLTADVIARAFRYLGTEVLQVQNITDVGHMTDEVFGEAGEDRIEHAASIQDRTPEEIAEHYTEVFFKDLDLIGIERASSYPRASEHVPQMISMIERLIANGHGYEIDGTVYFDTTSFPGYGSLSGNSLDALEADHRKTIADSNKKHPSDFVLWMRAGPKRLRTFESPWGTGFPGWHIECSAMSIATLGERFDLHTGGEDNVFPHHEDELAQSEGAVGHEVVRHWVHGAHVLAEGRKMSKSAHNDMTLADLETRGHRDARALRLLFLQSRYRHQLNFSFDALTAAERGLQRWRRHAQAWAASGGAPDEARQRAFEARFQDAIADDLDTPAALSLISEIGSSSELTDADRLALLARWDRVLSLDLVDDQMAQEAPSEVVALRDRRADARRNRDFAEADRLRELIESQGFEVHDAPTGSTLVRR